LGKFNRWPVEHPIDLKIINIDPCQVIDDNGKQYLYSANGGHIPLSDDGLSVTGETKHVYNGWIKPCEWTIECFCLEGPKITKRGEYFYLTVAEGGTAGPATGHMIISARSKTPFGPWENSPYNPILRTTSNSVKWWSTGHRTIFEDTNGSWWIVFHGHENGYYNMGRQTLLLPIEWSEVERYNILDGFSAE
jgi:xylan 1,4-beta-xylosidase